MYHLAERSFLMIIQVQNYTYDTMPDYSDVDRDGPFFTCIAQKRTAPWFYRTYYQGSSSFLTLFQKRERFLVIDKVHQLICAHDSHMLFFQDPSDFFPIGEDNFNLLTLLQITLADLPF